MCNGATVKSNRQLCAGGYRWGPGAGRTHDARVNCVIRNQLCASGMVAMKHKIVKLDNREDPVNRRRDDVNRRVGGLDVPT